MSDIRKQDFDWSYLNESSQNSEKNIQNIELEVLRDFPDHPFSVNFEDEDMTRLVQSINENGVMCPGIARNIGKGYFGIISGHRRKAACELLGIEKMPFLIVEMSDEEATIAMVDANLHRERIKLSEKAFAYKMKLDVIKQERNTGAQVEPQGRSTEKLALFVNDSSAQIKRLLRLTYLNEDLLKCVDQRKLAFNTAVEISYLRQEEMSTILKIYQEKKKFPLLKSAKEFREYSEQGTLNESKMREIINNAENKKSSMNVPDSFFPKNSTLTSEEKSDLVRKLLSEYFKKENA
ncbi:ParB family chromosome partitioning protein [Clostridiales Family XIII bacterium PM5-7]